MGWDYSNEKVTRNAESLDKYFDKEENRIVPFVGEGHYENEVYYRAYKDGDKVSCAVVYTHIIKDEKGEWFGVKPMSEMDGPFAYDCPNKILDMLSPTTNEYAQEWRNECRQRNRIKGGKMMVHEMDVPFDVTEKKTPYMTLEEAEKDWKRWADIKSKTLNGKDAAALMGDAPWRTKAELLAEKKKFISFVPEKGSKEANIMQRGLDLQEEAKKRFMETTGVQLQEGAIYRSEETPVMVARVQFLDARKGIPVQIMTTGAENAALWENGAPQNVIDEAQWNMALTGAKTAQIGCLIDDRENSGKDGLKFVAVSVARDDKMIAKMIKEAERFAKDMESKFLNVVVSNDMVTKKGLTYEVKMPEGSSLEGASVVIPEKMAHKTVRGDAYRLNLPVQNMKGKSFLLKCVGKDNIKSVSSAEVFCAVNKTRGKTLFANNRSSLRQYYEKKQAEKASELSH